MAIDKRFTLIADNGDLLYPYIKTERKPPNRTGFFISRPGQKDLPEVTNDIELVIKRVVVDGWSVRARTESGQQRKRDGVFGLAKSAVHDFKLAPELAHLARRLLEHSGERSRRLQPDGERDALPSAAAKQVADPADAANVDHFVLSAAAQEIDAEFSGQELESSTRTALISARVGQGDFRRDVLSLWRDRCAVTGCSVTKALIASHARAWSDCKTTRERLDKYNGLPLTASIDKLFDRGLISFADDGRLLRKSELADTDLMHLGLTADARLRADCLDARHLPYLAAHRAKWKF